MDLTPDDTITCFECEGKGRFDVLFSVKQLTCPACEGTGRLQRACEGWRVIGRAMFKERLQRLVSMRQEARNRGLTLTELSKMERGLIEPKPHWLSPS